MNLNALMGEDTNTNEHFIAWASKDWDAVADLADSFKEPAEDVMFKVLNELTYNKERLNVGNMNYATGFVNMAMSQHVDCVYPAYVMNMLHDLPDQAQFDYYLHSVRKGKRYGKWAKPEEDSLNKLHIYLIAKYYNISLDAAVTYKKIMEAKGTFEKFLRLSKGLVTEKFVATIVKTKKEQQQLLKRFKT